jgi:anaerobic ribonucleoside-triphosphate reductase activating protein
MDIEELKREISQLSGQDGITLSGGDPMFQVEACLEIAKFCKQIGLSVWCYTGFTFEELLDMSKSNYKLTELMKNIDVLIDGRFIESKKSLDLYYRGSSNQRILDLKKSLKSQKPIEIEKYKQQNVEPNENRYGKHQYIFI